MGGGKSLPPGSAELLRLIRRMRGRGQTVTVGILFRKRGKSKTSTREMVLRLEQYGRIKRTEFTDGKERRIELT